MTIEAKVIEQAVNFTPAKNSALETIDLGLVAPDQRLVHGLFRHQLRAVGLPGQPLVAGETTQPVWALVQDSKGPGRGRVVRPLAYAEDIRALGELANPVLDRINAVSNPHPVA